MEGRLHSVDDNVVVLEQRFQDEQVPAVRRLHDRGPAFTLVAHESWVSLVLLEQDLDHSMLLATHSTRQRSR
jgi:hypothetical protein